MKTELPVAELDEEVARSIINLQDNDDWKNVVEYIRFHKALIVQILLSCDSELDSFLKGGAAALDTYLDLEEAACQYFESLKAED